MAPHTGQPRRERASAARWHMAHSIIDTQNTPSQRVRRRGRPGKFPGRLQCQYAPRRGVLCAGNFCKSALQADDEVAAFVDGEQHGGPLAGIEGVDHAHRRRRGNAVRRTGRRAWRRTCRAAAAGPGRFARPGRAAAAGLLRKQGHTYHRCVRRALARAKGRSVMHGEHPFWTHGVAKSEDRRRSCSYYAARRAPVSAQNGYTTFKEGFL